MDASRLKYRFGEKELMQKHSLLKQARLDLGWSRAYVEAKTGIPQRSLENWENGICFPRGHNIDILCALYGKTPAELGLMKSDIMVSENTVIAHQGEITMSEIVRRSVLASLGSKLASVIDAWPKRNHHYAELQGEISKVIVDFDVVAAQEPTYEQTRRQAIKDIALAPIELMGGIALIEAGKMQKTDTDLLLKRCAAGMAACWYLRRGKELNLVADLASTYIFLLQTLVSSRSEASRKASAELLAQCFRLKGDLSRFIEGISTDQATTAYYNEAMRYALISGSVTEQVIVNRVIAIAHWRQNNYEQALPYAEKAYALVNKNSPQIVLSFVASGLSLCQAVNGQTEEAKISLKEARDFFDPTLSIPSIPYTESNLIAISADIHRHCAHWQESTDLWAESLVVSDISTLGSIQGRINYAKAEVSRDDKLRDLDLCIRLLTEAIIGATELSSRLNIREASEAYNLLRIAWPNEGRVKNLGKEHF
jgi:transcriptional regulator with XRE-family HTH domain